MLFLQNMIKKIEKIKITFEIIINVEIYLLYYILLPKKVIF